MKKRRRGYSAPIVAKIRRSHTQAYGSNWAETSARVKKRDGYRCRKCGVQLPPYMLHAHHIVPVGSMGGRTLDINLITLCETCHSKQPHHGHMRR